MMNLQLRRTVATAELSDLLPYTVTELIRFVATARLRENDSKITRSFVLSTVVYQI